MTDLEKMELLYTELKIGYTKTENYDDDKIGIFLHYSNFTFVFSNEGEYIQNDISYD